MVDTALLVGGCAVVTIIISLRYEGKFVKKVQFVRQPELFGLV